MRRSFLAIALVWLAVLAQILAPAKGGRLLADRSGAEICVSRLVAPAEDASRSSVPAPGPSHSCDLFCLSCPGGGDAPLVDFTGALEPSPRLRTTAILIALAHVLQRDETNPNAAIRAGPAAAI